MTTQTAIQHIQKAKASICQEPNCQARSSQTLSQEAKTRAYVIKLSSLMSKERLNVDDIYKVRKILEILNPKDKSSLFNDLQTKVFYINQRDAQVRDGKVKVEHPIDGGTCNVASLAMVTKYMGIKSSTLDEMLTKYGFPWDDFDKDNMQYEDKLDYLGQYALKKWNRYSNDSHAVLAGLLGLKSEKFAGGSYDYQWYKENILPKLEAGKGAMMSINGHIVRIQAVTENGLIVDDPYGNTKLMDEWKYKFSKMNDNFDSKNDSYNDNRHKDKQYVKESDVWNVGEDNIWAWDDLEGHGTYWIRVYG